MESKIKTVIDLTDDSDDLSDIDIGVEGAPPKQQPQPQEPVKHQLLLPRMIVDVPEEMPKLEAVVDEFDHLHRYGYQIIDTPVLTQAECEARIGELWDWLESLQSGITREDPNQGVWPNNIHGIVNQPSAAHTLPVWKIRSHPNVVALFSRLWKCRPEDLISSFDRICIQRPSTRTKPQKGWLHIDQGARIMNQRCYQGLVTLVDMPSTGGTLVVVPGSHLHHREFFERFPDEVSKSNDNWVRFNEEQLRWWREEKKLSPIRINARAGQLVLWDSRTAHQGSYPLPKTEPIWRWVVYTCLKPRPKPRNNGADAEKLRKAMAKKRRHFELGRTTSHWPVPEPITKRTKTGKLQLDWQQIKCFPEKPRTYGNDAPVIVEPPTSLKMRSVEELRAQCGDIAVSLAGF